MKVLILLAALALAGCNTAAEESVKQVAISEEEAVQIGKGALLLLLKDPESAQWGKPYRSTGKTATSGSNPMT